MRKRIGYFEEGLQEVHAALKPNQRLLIEYKPFEPAFYHTDIADWGMALLLAKDAGPQALWCWSTPDITTRRKTSSRSWPGSSPEDMMGGFHFNDRRYADDDLTLGSIDPYQVFRIFHEISSSNGNAAGAGDRLHGGPEPQPRKAKIEAMIQTV